VIGLNPRDPGGEPVESLLLTLPPAPRAMTWVELRDRQVEDDTRERQEECARAEFAEAIRRRQNAENYAVREAAQLDAIRRARTTG